MIAQPQGLPEGIYFHLSDDEYHNDPALSHSGMTKVLISWPDYWVSSCLNHERKKLKTTEAMEFGKQSGMLLTQPKVFHETYNTHGRSSPIAKGMWLSSVQWEKINDSITAITDMAIGRDFFKDGYAEVAVFWRDPGTGIMLRVKFDYLRTFGCIDVKRIKGLDPYTVGGAIRDQGLDIQNFLYLEGINAARRILHGMMKPELLAFSKAQGVAVDWLESLRDDTDLLFRFLFQRSTPPYIWDFIELEDEALVEGANSTFAAIKRYCIGIEKYGIRKPPMGRDRVRKIGSFHIPRRRYEYED